MNQPPPLSHRTKLFYGLGSVAFGVKDNGFSYLLLPFYNQVVGLSAPLVGLAILLVMTLDAVADPLIGQLSDNWRSPWGRRHPFMYAAALPVALSYLLLWNPPHAAKGLLLGYLFALALLIRTFISCFEVPNSALSAELASGYDERTVLLSYRYFFGWIGGLALYIVAFTFFFTPDARHPVGQTNPVGYARYGLLAAAMMFLAMLGSAAGTHDRIPTLAQPPERRITLGQMISEILAAWSHRSFLFLTLSGVGVAMGAGLAASMNFYFNTFYWGFSARQIGMLAAGVVIGAFLALWMGPFVSRRIGKRATAVTLMTLGVLATVTPVLARLAGLMPPNHSPALFWTIFATSIASVAFGVAGQAAADAMIADVVEEGELRTGRRSEGVYFSASVMIRKVVSGVGIFAASGLLALAAFPTGVAPDRIPPHVLARLALTFAPLYAGLYGLGFLLLAGYRITRASHAATLERLAARTAVAD